MQIALVSPLCVALLLSFAGAPLYHVHEQQTHHHNGLGTHTHLPAPRSSEQAAIAKGDEDSNAKEINWFQFEQPGPQLIPIVLIQSPSLDTPQLLGVRINRHLPRIHDPPRGNSVRPRAPPA